MASEKSFGTMIGLMIMVIVIFVVIGSQVSSLFDNTISNINYLSASQDEMTCDSGYFKVAYCLEGSDCDDKEIKNWEKYVNYLGDKKCDTLESKSEKGFSKELACTCVQKKIFDLIQNKGEESVDVDKIVISGDFKNFEKSLTLDDIDYRNKFKSVLSSDFFDKVEKISENLGTKPEYLIAIMNFETGGSFSPSIQNSIGATGLIQFTKTTAKGLGTTTDDLKKMSRLEQLVFVENYLKPYKGKMNSLSNAYMAVFLPSTLKLTDDSVISKNGDKYYDKNEGLDKNNDGYIQKSEAVYLVSKNYNDVILVS